MPYDTINNQWTPSDEMVRLKTEKKAALELQERKHNDWDGNYELYRNKVRTNRLTQRQAVNIPLMKETIKTLLSRIDDPPEVEWKENGSDQMKELIYQEIWDDNARHNKLELIDVLDKKNVLLYGLSTKMLNPSDFGVSIAVLDVYDVAYDPLMNPWDIESSRFVIRHNIFRSIREILADERYTEQGKQELRVWADSPPGLTQSAQNREEFEKKMERLKAMGIESSDFSHFAGGDRLINLTEHYTNRWNATKKEFEKRVVVYAEDCIELLDETLDELIGVDFWPFVLWSEDPETNDIYPDSVADLVRTPNKVLNIWYSQMLENRTLKNFQMHWFLPVEGYQPQTYTPGPGVMLPAPPGEDISKVIKPVEISGLEDTLEAMNYITSVVERGTGATAIEKGQPEGGQQTLGEVQILVGKANERAVGMAKFYRMAWYELAWKWDKMMHANPPEKLDLVKVGRDGKAYPKRVLMNDWMSEKGYEPVVRSSSEQETEDVKNLQKFNFVMQQSPNNQALRQIGIKRQLKMLDLTPEELKQIEEGEKQAQQMVMQEQNPAAAPMAPDQENMAMQLEQNIAALTGTP